MNTPIEQAPQEAPLLPSKLRNARALWVVLIIMALLAGCALLFARGSMRLSGEWQTQLSDTLTVQVILDNAAAWEQDTKLARDTLTPLFPGADIEILPESEARALLQPWLGNAALPEDLPVPGLLNVTGQNLGAIGAIIGLTLAALLWLCLSILGDWGGLGWTGFMAGATDILWLIGLGAVFAIICAVAAGVTATRQLAFERKRL